MSTTIPGGAPVRDRASALRRWAPDAALCLACAAIAGVAAWRLYAFIDPMAIGEEQYFQSDLPRVWAVLTDRYSFYHERSRIHPLYSLFNTPAVYGLRRVFGLDPVTAVRLWTAIVAGLWAATFYVTARLLRQAVPDAALLTALAATSAAALCWIPVPETYAMGSATILACIGVAALCDRRPMSDAALTATTAATLSMTVTNALSAGVLLLRTRAWRRALQIGVNAVFVILVLQVAQNLVFRETHFMLEGLGREQRFLFDQSAGGVTAKLSVMLSHALVMPRPSTPIEFDTRTAMASFQQSAIGSSGASGWAGSVLWWMLLGWGLSQLVRQGRQRIGAFVCGGTAAAQVLLHSVYGDQTFLYSLNIMAPLVLVAGMALQAPGRTRHMARVLALALLAVVAFNNAAQMVELGEVLREIAVREGTATNVR